jgi:hypothetical protein
MASCLWPLVVVCRAVLLAAQIFGHFILLSWMGIDIHANTGVMGAQSKTLATGSEGVVSQTSETRGIQRPEASISHSITKLLADLAVHLGLLYCRRDFHEGDTDTQVANVAVQCDYQADSSSLPRHHSGRRAGRAQ